LTTITIVIPAQAGIQPFLGRLKRWMPTFVGMTVQSSKSD
jgi:hypothetical protein